uniref:Ribosomal RNA methyltransferase FtsJ domain-containing protein n=1 Tax=viral metagenome TaxID=1070528 RepID=A0A6C0KPV3_9ZZZZ
MTYINLPNLNNLNLDFNIIYKNDKTHLKNNLENNDILLCNSLHHYLLILKQSIDEYYEYWDIMKKITNPYEYIHTIVPNHKCSLCKYKPLSRSFFKMIEMINTFDFLTDRNPIQSFHLAEGPGGFIEAFNYKRKNPADIYYGMTLINDNSNIPSWKKASHILNSNKNIKLEYGASKNGDLFLKENLLYCNKKYAKCMDYITGDGGFDFSSDFNNQEDISFKLILSQVFYALIMQKKGGHFVLKIFDVFKIKTVEVIYLLCNLYENVFIFKPNTSRSANSEKYIICRNYKNNNKRIISNIIENFDILINQVESIHSLFNIHFNQLFITKLQEINAIYGQQQLENIKNTLGLIRELKMLNIEYNLLNYNNYNGILKYLNISNKIYLHSIEEILIEKNNNHNTNTNIDNINGNNDNNDNNGCEAIETLTIEDNLDIDLVDFEHSIISTNFKTSKEYNISAKEILVNKYFNKLNMLININMQKSINWCKKHNFSVNKEFLSE